MKSVFQDPIIWMLHYKYYLHQDTKELITITHIIAISIKETTTIYNDLNKLLICIFGYQ